MKNNIKRKLLNGTIFLSLLLIIFPAFGQQKTKVEENGFPIIPIPQNIIPKAGMFTLSDECEIVSVGQKTEAIEKLSRYFAEIINKDKGIKIAIKKSKKQPEGDKKIILQINKNISTEEGGYKLTISSKQIIAEANKTVGLFYALQSLRQLYLTQNTARPTIPCAEIFDAPRYKWRGFMLDCGRHFFSTEFIKRYIDYLAFNKMNIFHWHLTESAAWRIEIKKYPKLTEVGAWRVDRIGTPWKEQAPPKENEKADYGGFYSQEEIKEIIKYAEERFITIIPEIEMPGHCMASLAAYPEYSCTGGPFKVPTGGVKSRPIIYCAGKEKTFKFLEDILTEVCELFPSPYIHIGGDEADKDNWKKCPNCQKRIKDEKLKNEDELQSYFIKRIEKFLISKNKKLIGWDEILEGGLAPEATVMSWRSINGGLAAAKAGHDAIMTPKHACYFDYRQGYGNEPSAPKNSLLLHEVYSLNPDAKELTKQQLKHILGVQANLWTEYVENEKTVEYMTFPRLLAMAEVAWTNQNKRKYSDFISRLAHHYPLLDKWNIKYRQPDLIGFEDKNIFTDKTEIEIIAPRLNSEIRYTLDGTEPHKASKLYTKPIPIKRRTTIIAREFMPDGRFGRVKKGVFIKQEAEEAKKVSNLRNGLRYKYIKKRIGSVKYLFKTKASREGITNNFIIPAEFDDNKFGMIYEGYIKVPKTGVYTFYTISCDGSILYINDKPVTNNDGGHPQKEKEGQIALKKGLHKIKVGYFDSYQAEFLEVYYKTNGIEKRIISDDMLFIKN